MQPSASRSTKLTLAQNLSRSGSRIKVRPGDKFLIPGTTGCGKTTFVRELIAHWIELFPTTRIYINDFKNVGDFDMYPGRVQSVEAPPLPGKNERFQVWTPIGRKPESLEQWMKNIFSDAPAFLVIDEAVILQYKTNEFSQMYMWIAQMGRAMPIGMATITQKLSKLPDGAIGQATHVVRFRLKKKYDQLVSTDLLGEEVPEPPDEFGFYYQKTTSNGSPRYFKSYEEFFS